MAKTRAQQNRSIRQEALRDQLATQKHIEYVVKNVKKIEALDVTQDNAATEVMKLKTASELRLKLVNKYLPDVKQVEITAEVEVIEKRKKSEIEQALADKGVDVSCLTTH